MSPLDVIATIFWGVLLLGVVVFIHEGGHFLVARAQGIRVTEFFLGLPCRWRISRTSKRYGTRWGVTALLIGGYNQICGLAGNPPAHMAEVLAALMARGRATTAELAEDTGLDTDTVMDALVGLSDWASVEPYYDPEKGERPSQSTYPDTFQTVDRDANLLTRFDKGNDFSLPGATQAGEPQSTDLGPEEFLDRERSHTFQGDGLLGRIAMLVAGVGVNIAFGILIVVVALMTYGVTASVDVNEIGTVAQGGLAEQVGLEPGDLVLDVAGQPVGTWREMAEALRAHLAVDAPFTLGVERDGVVSQVEIPAQGDPEAKLGIEPPTTQVPLSLGDALAYTLNYLSMVATMILRLFQPAHVGEVIQNSTSIVGITVMAGQAASQGIIPYVLIAASVSISLGFVNLLPIPPLDGGKIVIEVIQAIIRRPLSEKVLLAFNYVGIGLFMLLFFVLLQQDVLRFVLGG